MKKQILSLIILVSVAVMATAQTNTMRAFTAGGVTTINNSYGVFGQPFAGIQNANYEITAGVAQMQLERDTVVTLLTYGDNYEIYNKTYTNVTENIKDSIYVVNGGIYNYDILHYVYIIVCTDSVADKDGSGVKYGVIALGGRCWTKQNLRSTEGNPMKYNSEQHPETSIDFKKYGYLYTWEDAQNVCPDGWFLPNDTVMDVVYSQDVTAIRATEDWNTQEVNTNSTRFSAYPAGEFSSAANRFQGMGSQTNWWTTVNTGSSMATSLEINYYCNTPMYKQHNVNDGLSVRCYTLPDVPDELLRH